MCTKEPSPKNQETQVLFHLPQSLIHHLTSLGLFLKCQTKMENMYLLLYKFDGRIKRKSTGFLINVLTLCSVTQGPTFLIKKCKTVLFWLKPVLEKPITCQRARTELSNLELQMIQSHEPWCTTIWYWMPFAGVSGDRNSWRTQDISVHQVTFASYIVVNFCSPRNQ